jgi:A-kinase anchor protein 13
MLSYYFYDVCIKYYVFSYSDEVSLVQFEFLNESMYYLLIKVLVIFILFIYFSQKDHITAHDLETDPALGLHEEQPDSWSPTVTKEVSGLF